MKIAHNETKLVYVLASEVSGGYHNIKVNLREQYSFNISAIERWGKAWISCTANEFWNPILRSKKKRHGEVKRLE